MKATYKLAMAAGQDVANKNAKAGGRSAWNAEDWDVAAATYAKIMGPQTDWAGEVERSRDEIQKAL